MTDLEAIVLGVIQGSGPCTAYQIHQAFLKSPSHFFSGSAGAIYPVVKRMKGRGFTQAEASQTGRRKSEMLTLTNAGRHVLLDWMQSFEAAADGGFDPARARLNLLSKLLPTSGQLEYLAKLSGAIEERLRAIETTDNDADTFDWAGEIERAALVAKAEVIRSWVEKTRHPDDGGEAA